MNLTIKPEFEDKMRSTRHLVMEAALNVQIMAVKHDRDKPEVAQELKLIEQALDEIRHRLFELQ